MRDKKKSVGRINYGFEPKSKRSKDVLPKAPKGGTRETHPFWANKTFQTTSGQQKETEERLDRIEEKIDRLNRRLDLIFGDHVMIDGKLVDVRNK